MRTNPETPADGPVEFGSPYATHLEVTVACAVRSGLLWPESSMLEFGCGDYSTPALAAIALAQQRRLCIVSSDPHWAQRYAYLAGSWFEIRVIERAQWPHVDYGSGWGLVLVDNEQRVVQRCRHVLQLASRAKLVVLHDSQVPGRCAPFWREAYRHYRFVYHFRQRVPATTVFSNHVDPTPWFVC
jgi:hypothetical protein